MAGRIHLAAVPPPFCAACHNPKPQSRFVDFDAAFEGPSFAAGDDAGVTGGGPVTSDELVICEECLTFAAAELGLGNVEEALEQAAGLAGELERMSDRLAVQAAHIEALEAAAASRLAHAQAMQTEPASAQQATGSRGAPGRARDRHKKAKVSG